MADVGRWKCHGCWAIWGWFLPCDSVHHAAESTHLSSLTPYPSRSAENIPARPGPDIFLHSFHHPSLPDIPAPVTAIFYPSLDHGTDVRLLECWYQAVIIKFFICTTHTPGHSSHQDKHNFHQTRCPLSSKNPHDLCPCFPFVLLCFLQVHLPSNEIMVPFSCKMFATVVALKQCHAISNVLERSLAAVSHSPDQFLLDLQVLFLVELVTWYFYQIFLAVPNGISAILAASGMGFPAWRIPINLFFNFGEACWVWAIVVELIYYTT